MSAPLTLSALKVQAIRAAKSLDCRLREAARYGAIPKARPGHLEVETTYDDPGTFKKPFTTRYVKLLAPGDWETLEYVCAENNREFST